MDGSARRGGLPGAYLSTLALTLTNPMTILSFAALFVGLGVTGGDAAGATLLTLGVFARLGARGGSCSSQRSGRSDRGSRRAGLRRVNMASGLLIGAFAIVAIVSSLA